MDQELLVKEAQSLTMALDHTKVKPRFAAIIISQETGNWKMWIVPSKDVDDKRELYRLVAEGISTLGLSSIDVGLVEMKKDQDRSVVGLSKMMRMEGVGSAFLSDNTFDGILLPDGILIRSTL